MLAKITYTYPSFRFWQKPAVILGSLLLAFVVIYVISNLDLSIVEDPKKELEKRVKAARKEVAGLVSKDQKALFQLSSALAEFKGNKNLESLKEVETSNFAIIESVHSTLASKGNEFKFDAEFGKKVKTLAGHIKARLDTVRQRHQLVVDFFTSKEKDSEEKRAKLSKSLEGLESTESTVSSKIEAVIEQL